MKFLRIFLCAAFIFTIASCHKKDGSIYEYPDEDSNPAEKGDIGDPCEKNIDCKTGLLCIDKVCSETSEKDDEDTDSDENPDKDDETIPDDADDSDSDIDTDDNDDSDVDTDTNDEDEPDDNDTQPDEDSDTTPYNPECGNGITEMGEECDDGFANSDEPGTYNSTCRTNCRFARCGDGITDSGEACDDGNRLNGDYCSADCSEITGWCGDGKIQIGLEACDNADPNTGSREGTGDYCSNDCSEIVGSCGDGIVQSNEKCDKANPGEGGGHGIGPHYCSDNCMEITGWCGDGIQQIEVEDCDDGANNGKYDHCNTTCTGTIGCGDGVVQPAYEKCDDGNNENGDYCSADCQIDNGSCGDGIVKYFEICDKANPGEGGGQGIGAYCSDDCKEILGECGDNKIDAAAGEECDEGPNPNTGCTYGTVVGCQVCSSTCRKIPGTRRYCGDGTIQSDHENCDDGNTVDGDYCSADCQTVTGSCGDGIKQNNEACDTDLDPYCSADCKTIAGTCGDGDINGNEECDLGADNGKTDCAYGENCKVCTTECEEIDGTRHYCGDGTKDAENGEACDDGEMNGSYNQCKEDCSGIGEHCGDGIENGDEDCDLGEGVNGTITDCAYDERECKVCSANCTEIDGNTSYCGDHRVDPDNEVCDTALDPYCADNCKSWTGSCGDGTVQPNEACDKADPSVGEGFGTGAYCSFDCQESYGECGDGVQKGPEQCDDGANNGKYNTTGQSPYCNASCSAYDSGYCGDLKIQNSSCGGDPDCTEMPDAAEECDNGSDNGQTACEYGETSCMVCNSNCKLRNGETSRCGDGIIQRHNCEGYGTNCVVSEDENANEACDDGNTVDGDYCSADCRTETGSCGDGTVQDNEVCDRADPSVGEGQGTGTYCSYNCQESYGECGDGTIQPNEVCDRADPSVGIGQGTGAYCSFNCQESYGECGDGIKQDGIEACDKALDPYCNDDCSGTIGECGDGIKQDGIEACDKAIDPYCNDDCSGTIGSCGDNEVNGGETCDDGDDNGTYNHCNSSCDGYMARCGDKTKDEAYGEVCDEGDGADGHNGEYNHCSSDCKFIMECGDGRIQSQYENCDDGENNGKYNTTGNTPYCNASCSAYNSGYCGDGRIQNSSCGGDPNCTEMTDAAEECDNGNANGSTYCTYNETSCEVCTRSCTIEAGKPAYCGDKKIQKGSAEECDAYVALDPVNNKLCDDVVTENCCEVVAGAEENCDDGDENGNFGKCDDTCSEIVTWQCGDGEIDGQHGETCDDGAYNGTPHHCNSTCNGPTPYCGDAIIQQEICTWVPCDEETTQFCCKIVEGMHEACDHGDHNGEPGYCHSDCTGWCGDGILQKHDCDGYGSNCVVSIEVDEACDEGRDNGQSGHCNQICSGTTAVCGNGTVEYGEKCDDGNTAGNDYCSPDCQTETGYCGDGTKQNNETCDEGEENNGYHGHCNEECNGYSSCGDGKLGKDEYCDPSDTENTMIAEIPCSYLPQFGSTLQTTIINSCTADCLPVLSQCEYNDPFTSPFFKTGQELCYSNDGIDDCHVSTSLFFGQEPEFVYTAHSYDTSNANVIQDNSTGLMWQKDTPDVYGAEIEGYGYMTCTSDSGRTCPLNEANGYCSILDLGGYDDWRVPTAAELSTITDYNSATRIYSGFTNTTGSYWTNEGLVFSTADGTYLPWTGTAKIKCVRSVSEESNCTSLQCQEKAASLAYVFDSTNTAITVSANTESPDSAIFNFWYFEDPDNGDTWQHALATCSGFDNSNGLDKMRLPTVNELMWLIDRTNGGSLIPRITGTAWTSTTVPSNTANAYAVKFSDGSVISAPKTSDNIVICIE